MKITRSHVVALKLPPPVRRIALNEQSAQAAEPVHLVAVQVTTDIGTDGFGFTASVGPGLKALLAVLADDLLPELEGEDGRNVERHFARAQARFRSIGWAGLTARAYAAIDIALWDLRAKAAGLPLYQLLGGARSSASCFAGDLAPLGADPQQTVRAARPLLEQGVLGVAVEVGGGDVQLDADRVQQIRDGLGESAWLGIAAEGRYDLATALAMAHFYEEDVGIDWIDCPIPVEDRVGYLRLAERMEVPLAVGSSFDDRDDFRRVLERGDARVLRPDPLRLGGITPVVKVAALAEAFSVLVVPYRLPEVGVHLACGLPNVPMAEWGSWLAGAFAEPVRPREGRLVPVGSPGLGLTLNADAVERFRVE
ncbi:MAG TPA: mandelate racemase/muconate lactonizing enzyme family protein [Gemmataceae bacterium]|nr:mandelate racemase/muconate lactonizing enzyme family protein [Gemmataceae bacterium]